MSAAEVIKVARDAGIELAVDGDDLVLQGPAPPPATLLDLLSRHKAEVLAALAASPHDSKLLARTPPSLSPNRHLVEVPDRFAVARWSRDADVATIARCILGTLKYEPHTADNTALRRALEGVIEHEHATARGGTAHNQENGNESSAVHYGYQP
jgi:hypothetical protein